MLEGGAVLVVDIHVEDAEPVEMDPATIGASLLNALGLGRPTMQAPKGKFRKQPPPEPTAEEWLEQSSKEALRVMK